MNRKLSSRLLSLVLALLLLAQVIAPVRALADEASSTESPSVSTEDVYRLYNRYSGEHFYTASASERDYLRGIGWRYERVGWVAPAKSNTPIYRLYNPYTSDHHYTTDKNEVTVMVGNGWKDEGIKFYSDDKETVKLYRQFNPYEVIGTHNYTTDASERDALIRIGWKDEGIGWYAVGAGFSVSDADADVVAPTPSTPDSGGNQGGSGNQDDQSGHPTVVYVSDHGKKYHRESCPTIQNKHTTSYAYNSIPSGYEPCKVCKP